MIKGNVICSWTLPRCFNIEKVSLELSKLYSVDESIHSQTLRDCSHSQKSPTFCLNPANITLVKVNNKTTSIRCEINSKLTINTPEKCQWRCSGVVIVNFEFISLFFYCFIADFEQVNVFQDMSWKASRRFHDSFWGNEKWR